MSDTRKIHGVLKKEKKPKKPPVLRQIGNQWGFIDDKNIERILAYPISADRNTPEHIFNDIPKYYPCRLLRRILKNPCYKGVINTEQINVELMNPHGILIRYSEKRCEFYCCFYNSENQLKQLSLLSVLVRNVVCKKKQLQILNIPVKKVEELIRELFKDYSADYNESLPVNLLEMMQHPSASTIMPATAAAMAASVGPRITTGAGTLVDVPNILVEKLHAEVFNLRQANEALSAENGRLNDELAKRDWTILHLERDLEKANKKIASLDLATSAATTGAGDNLSQSIKFSRMPR